jgi:TonB family protein
MSKLLTYFFFFQCLNLGFSQQATSSVKTVPEPILIPNYKNLYPFRGDYAPVSNGQGKICLINKKGKEVTDYFEVTSIPTNGLMIVSRNQFEECAVVNVSDKGIAPFSSKIIVPFGKYSCKIFDDYITVSDRLNRQYKILDIKGRQILMIDKDIMPLRKNYFWTNKDSTHQIINEKGKVLAQTTATELKILNSRYFAFKKGEIWGILNDTFKEVLSPKYENILSLPYSWIGLYDKENYSILDSNLSVKIPFSTYEAIGFKHNVGESLIGDSLIPAKKNGLWGYINIDNQLVINYQFKSPSAFCDGHALQDKGKVLIDSKGKIVYTFPYKLKYESFLYGNLILAEIDNTKCYVDFEGNIILKCDPKIKNVDATPSPKQVEMQIPPELDVNWKALESTLSPKQVEMQLPPEEPKDDPEPQPKSAEITTITNVQRIDVDIQASYVGGFEALSKFLSDNQKYPKKAKKAGINGKVEMKFTIKTDGTLGNLIVVKSLGYGCDEEAIRLIKAMPKWTPASRLGKPVEQSCYLPFNFKP